MDTDRRRNGAPTPVQIRARVTLKIKAPVDKSQHEYDNDNLPITRGISVATPWQMTRIRPRGAK